MRSHDQYNSVKESAIPEFGANDAILDWKILRGSERPFKGIASLSDILCLFALAEAVVIYDKLWLAPADLKFIEVWKPLVESGVFASSQEIPDQLSDLSLAANFKHVAELLRHGDLSRLSVVGGIFDQETEPTYARYFFGEKCNIDSVLDPVLTSYVPLVREQGRKAMVARLSDTVTRLHKEEIDQIIAFGAPVPLYIPPVPAVILDRSAGYQNRIISELIVLREEFSNFRARYRQYQRIIRDISSHTVKEIKGVLQEGLYEVESALKGMAQKRTGSRLMSEILDISISASPSEISIDKPLGWLAKGLFHEVKFRIVRARAQCLFDLWTSAMRIAGYGSLLQRHFELEEKALSYDLDLVKSLSGWINIQIGLRRQQLDNWAMVDQEME